MQLLIPVRQYWLLMGRQCLALAGVALTPFSTYSSFSIALMLGLPIPWAICSYLTAAKLLFIGILSSLYKDATILSQPCHNNLASTLDNHLCTTLSQAAEFHSDKVVQLNFKFINTLIVDKKNNQRKNNKFILQVSIYEKGNQQVLQQFWTTPYGNVHKILRISYKFLIRKYKFLCDGGILYVLFLTRDLGRLHKIHIRILQECYKNLVRILHNCPKSLVRIFSYKIPTRIL